MRARRRRIPAATNVPHHGKPAYVCRLSNKNGKTFELLDNSHRNNNHNNHNNNHYYNNNNTNNSNVLA